MLTPHLLLALAMLSGPAPTAPESDAAAAAATTPAAAAVTSLDVREVPRTRARPAPPLNTRRLVRKRLETDPARPRRGADRPDRAICSLAEAGERATAERLRVDRHCATRPALSFRLSIAGADARRLHLPPPARLR